MRASAHLGLAWVLPEHAKDRLGLETRADHLSPWAGLAGWTG